MTPESSVKAQIKRWLSKLDYEVWYFMPVSRGYGKHGVPDFICCVAGHFIGIEAKAPGGKVTARQQNELEGIQLAKGGSFVVSSLADLAGIEEWLRCRCEQK